MGHRGSSWVIVRSSWVIVGHRRLKKSMFIENLLYLTTIWVIVGLHGINSTSSIYLWYQLLIWGSSWIIVGHRVFYKYPEHIHRYSLHNEKFMMNSSERINKITWYKGTNIWRYGDGDLIEVVLGIQFHTTAGRISALYQ